MSKAAKDFRKGSTPMQDVPHDNSAVIAGLQRKLMEHRLEASRVVLEHHTRAYKNAFRILWWLMFLTYAPLTILVLKLIFCDLFQPNGGMEILSLLSSFVKNGGGIVLVVLLVLPVLLLVGILRYNSIAAQNQEDNSSDISPLIFRDIS